MIPVELEYPKPALVFKGEAQKLPSSRRILCRFKAFSGKQPGSLPFCRNLKVLFTWWEQCHSEPKLTASNL
jgi:hypothetical protein